MLKVIIVDDEINIREGLRDCINWEANGLEIVTEASNGREALQKLDEHEIDIVITDIKMPFVDGIELMMKASEIYPEIRFIVISGHDEFSYAQAAIKHGAFGYVLKPVDIKELIIILEKVSVEIKKVKTREKKINQLQQNRNDIYLNKLLDRVIFNRLDEIEEPLIHKEIKNILNIEKGFHTVVIADIDDRDELSAEYGRVFESIMKNFYLGVRLRVDEKFNVNSVIEGHEKIIIYCYHKNCREMKLRMESLSGELFKYSRNKYNWSLSIAVGETVDSIMSIYKSYESARQLFKIRYIKSSGPTMLNQIAHECTELSYDDEIKYCMKQIIFELKTGGREELIEAVLKFKNKLIKSSGGSIQFIRASLSSVMIESLDVIKEFGIENSSIIKEGLHFCEDILARETLDSAVNQLCKIMIRFKDFLSIQNMNCHSSEIEKSMKFIEENYQRASIKIEEAAQNAGLSTSYFSSIFKLNTGESFIDYLMRYRIEKSKEMLINTNYRIFEISYKIGYENPGYFNRVFKKFTNQTPNEFRKSCNSTIIS